MTEPVLELAEVDAYYGESHVLFDVSLSVEQGEVVMLLGRNGAGKSTTLRSIMGIVQTRDGTITYRGEDITGRPTEEISRLGVKLVPEDRRIFPTLTVEENLSIARRLAGDRARDIDEVYEMFGALSDLRSSEGQNLSGGEQQMLSMARALIQNPDVLLLDEPSEGLAPVIVEQLRETLTSNLPAGVTILLAEQNVRFAFEIAERGYIIDRGGIVFEGGVDEFREDDEILDRYLSVSESDVQE